MAYDSIDQMTSVVDDAIASGGLSAATGGVIAGILAGLTAGSFTPEQITQATPEGDLTPTDVADITFPVVFMPDGATFDGTSSTIRAVIAGKDSDGNNINLTSNADVAVQLGGGAGDKVSTAGGNDAVTFVGGSDSSATINTADGNDTVVLRPYSTTDNGGEATVDLGTGNDTVQLRSVGNQGFEGKATIDGGDGFDELNVDQARSAHSFAYVDGKFVMGSAGITMENVNVVTFYNDAAAADDPSAIPDNITILADNPHDAIVAKLYQVALGREAIDNCSGTNGQAGDNLITGALGGISYWTEYYDNTNLQKTVYDFLGSGEFQQLYCGMDDQTFVTQLFHNLDKVSPNFHILETVNGKTVQDFVDQLDGTQESRWDVAWEIAASDQADQILGQDGIDYVIMAPGMDDGPQSA